MHARTCFCLAEPFVALLMKLTWSLPEAVMRGVLRHMVSAVLPVPREQLPGYLC